MSETIADLERAVGGLGNPSKMPGFAYGIPAAECKVGTKLRSVQGSTCSGCYAFERGRYAFPGVVAAQYRRLEALTSDLEGWVGAMSRLIARKCRKDPWFRWHDSGDLQSVDHLRAIAAVCDQTPEVNHWLPTREYRIVRDYLSQGGTIPANLTVRLSAHMVDGPAPSAPRGVRTSTVHRDIEPAGHACPAPSQGNACGDCRACWDPTVGNVSYHVH